MDKEENYDNADLEIQEGGRAPNMNPSEVDAFIRGLMANRFSIHPSIGCAFPNNDQMQHIFEEIASDVSIAGAASQMPPRPASMIRKKFHSLRRITMLLHKKGLKLNTLQARIAIVLRLENEIQRDIEDDVHIDNPKFEIVNTVSTQTEETVSSDTSKTENVHFDRTETICASSATSKKELILNSSKINNASVIIESTRQSEDSTADEGDASQSTIASAEDEFKDSTAKKTGCKNRCGMKDESTTKGSAKQVESKKGLKKRGAIENAEPSQARRKIVVTSIKINSTEIGSSKKMTTFQLKKSNINMGLPRGKKNKMNKITKASDTYHIKTRQKEEEESEIKIIIQTKKETVGEISGEAHADAGEDDDNSEADEDNSGTNADK